MGFNKSFKRELCLSNPIILSNNMGNIIHVTESLHMQIYCYKCDLFEGKSG